MDPQFEKIFFSPFSALKHTGFHDWPPTFHSHAELLYVMEGEISITVDGISHTVTAGEVAVLFPYLPHSYAASSNVTAISLMFEPSATAFDNTLLTQKPVCWWQDGRALQPLFERIVVVRKQKLIKTATGYLNAVLGELLEMLELEPRSKADRNHALQILSYCAEHYTQDISVKSVADALYISQSYVSKIFSHKLHYSFPDYINTLRVHKAKILLRDTDRKILEIMMECGFRNQGNFNRVFRKATGLSPVEYRAKMAANR